MKSSIQDQIKTLARLDIDKYVRRGTEKVEENVKIKLVIPLFELLGYDKVKDMDFEHHIRNRRADIALMFTNKPKLIVETKDLTESLDRHVDQALDYAFKKGVDWIVLTNGVETRLYKSYMTGVPSEDRILFSTSLENLPQSFSTLSHLASRESLRTAEKITKEAEKVRESVTAKILIKDLAECKEKLFKDLFGQFKGRYQADEKFKETIDSWAERVKMDLKDPLLIEKLCKEGAYTLINRVLFLRICEDKKHIKAKLCKDALAKWRQMVEKPSNLLDIAFREIADKFEGLYKAPLFDDISFEDIKWNEETINFVLDELGEYDFGKITKDILGRAYEQHITREERKQLGQFYTPDFVVNYILDNTLDVVLKEKPVQKIKILDPACGSGGFLMKAYDRLRTKYEQDGWADEVIHNEILKNNLYGIDINPFATQLTVMNLLLKDLEHPTGDINVIEGDALEKLENSFDLEIYQKESPLKNVTGTNKKLSQVKLLRNVPFHIVVANPPYITVWGIDNKTKKYLQKNYQCATGRFNTFTIFLERAIDLIPAGGRVGFVVPEGLLTHVEYQPIREYILAYSKILKIATMPRDTFTASVDVIVIILQKENDPKKRRDNQVQVTLHGDSSSITQVPTYNINQDLFLSNQYRMFFIFLTPDLQPVYKKVHSQTIPLGKLLEAQQGIIYSGLAKSKVFANSKLGKDYERILDGRDIARYQINYSLKAENRYLKYGKHLHRPREERLFLAPEKLLLQRKSLKLVATYDDEQFYGLNTLYILVPRQTEYKVTLKYLLALLNSSLMNWVYSKTWVGWQVTIPALDILPIKVPDVDIQQELEDLVDKMLTLNKQVNDPVFAHKKKDIEGEIEKTGQKINENVYQLYGITEKERQLVEGAV